MKEAEVEHIGTVRVAQHEGHRPPFAPIALLLVLRVEAHGAGGVAASVRRRHDRQDRVTGPARRSRGRSAVDVPTHARALPVRSNHWCHQQASRKVRHALPRRLDACPDALHARPCRESARSPHSPSVLPATRAGARWRRCQCASRKGRFRRSARRTSSRG